MNAGSTMGLVNPHWSRYNGANTSFVSVGGSKSSSPPEASCGDLNVTEIPSDVVKSSEVLYNLLWRVFDEMSAGNKTGFKEAIALLYLVKHPEKTDDEMAEALGCTQGAVNSWKWTWSDDPQSGEYGLIHRTPDPKDRRKRVFEWTPKGRRFLTKLKDMIG